MNLSTQAKLAVHIQRLLKVTDVSFPLARTNNGDLSIKYSKDKEGYQILLDSVPLPTEDVLNDESNIELKAILEKYLG